MAVEKITRFVKVGFTESEARALAAECARDDRDPSVYIRRLVRHHLFGVSDRAGIVVDGDEDVQWMNSERAGL
jgi:hypothetical protein